MPTDVEIDAPPHELLLDFPDSDIFVTHGATDDGIRLCRASPDFKAVSDRSLVEDIAGCDGADASPTVMDDIATCAGLSRADAFSALAWLDRTLAVVQQKVVMERVFLKASSAWVVRVTEAGVPMVCSVTVLLQWYPDLSWDYVTATYSDVSQHVPICGLLQAIISGKGTAMITSLREKMTESLMSRGPLLSLQDEASAEGAPALDQRRCAVQDALSSCSSGPVTLRLTKGKLCRISDGCHAESPDSGAESPDSCVGTVETEGASRSKAAYRRERHGCEVM